MGEVRNHFDPKHDFVMIPRVPLDTLDFTSYTMNLGSKMVIDATRKGDGRGTNTGNEGTRNADLGRIQHLKGIDRRIVEMKVVHDVLLLAKVTGHGRDIVEKLVQHTELAGVRIIAAVSEDVNLGDKESYIWGIFTRFDCARDVLFTEQKLIGISPVYSGIMGIDATWKEGYPKPLVMREDVKRKVEERWGAYWKGG
jgi:4-hydroxy-3-polyprenylbenzoate decarboxylase